MVVQQRVASYETSAIHGMPDSECQTFQNYLNEYQQLFSEFQYHPAKENKYVLATMTAQKILQGGKMNGCIPKSPKICIECPPLEREGAIIENFNTPNVCVYKEMCSISQDDMKDIDIMQIDLWARKPKSRRK